MICCVPTDTALEWNIPIWLVLYNHESSIKQTKFNNNTVENYCLMSFHWGRTGPKKITDPKYQFLISPYYSQKHMMKKAEKYLEGHRVLKELPLMIYCGIRISTTVQTKNWTSFDVQLVMYGNVLSLIGFLLWAGNKILKESWKMWNVSAQPDMCDLNSTAGKQ